MPDRDSIPRDFGAFRIERELWRGSRSTVYLARDTRDEAEVALKVLYPCAGCGVEAQKRFAALEASRLREIAHPNIVELRKHGETDGLPYLSFPFIQGKGLDRALGHKEISTPEILVAVVKVCRAVHHAHSKNVLHRDLKPRNILVDSKGEPVVLDWGLSWRMGGRGEQGVQNIIGTPAYMSPEQARGEESGLTAATDIYSLGAILYQLLTGATPFESDNSWKTLQMTMSLPPRRPTGLRSTLDSRIERIILNCLEKEPELRYASAKALANDLQRVLGDAQPKGPAGLLGRFFDI